MADDVITIMIVILSRVHRRAGPARPWQRAGLQLHGRTMIAVRDSWSEGVILIGGYIGGHWDGGNMIVGNIISRRKKKN